MTDKVERYPDRYLDTVLSGLKIRSHTNDLAGIAQLVERNLAKVEVASSSLVARSNS